MTAPPTVRRVLMTADAVGGVWTFALEPAKGLAAHGIEVQLATMGGNLSLSQQADAGGIGNLRLETSAWRLEWMENPWRDIERAGEWLLDLEARFAPDVVHLNSYVHGSIGWNAPVLMTAHSCVLSWWQAVHGETAPPEWDRYRAEVARGLRAASIVTAPSAAVLHAMERIYGRISNGRVIPNGRSASAFTPREKEPFILSAGRLWDRAKNVALLEEVAGDLAWPVYVAGDQQHPDGTRHEVRGCHTLGRLGGEELSRWYGRAAIYALPARYEPFGLSALEAALSGCALVLGDVPSLREVWGDCALFIHPDDRAAWRSGLNRMIRDNGARQAIAHRTRERARRFTPERMAAAYVCCYAEACREREAACAL